LSLRASEIVQNVSMWFAFVSTPTFAMMFYAVLKIAMMLLLCSLQVI